MAAPKYTDRIKAQELRSLALGEMIVALKGEDSDFKKQLLLRLAASVLPRLSEVTGENGEAMQVIVQVASEVAIKNGISTPDTKGSSEGHE